MKVPGLPYDFEIELQQISFREGVKPGLSRMALPSAQANDMTQLYLDAENDMVCILRWENPARKAAKLPPSMALVPFSNILSMVPMLAPVAAVPAAGGVKK